MQTFKYTRAVWYYRGTDGMFTKEKYYHDQPHTIDTVGKCLMFSIVTVPMDLVCLPFAAITDCANTW